MDLFDHQDAFVTATGHTFLQGGRQTGKTTAAVVDAWTEAREYGTHVDVICPTQGQAYEFIEMLLDVIYDVGADHLLWSENRNGIELEDGGSIVSHSSQSVEGPNVDGFLDDAEYLVIDEGCYIREELFEDLSRPGYGVELSVVGTPRPGHPIEEWSEKETVTTVWASTWDNPRIDPERITDWRERLGVIQQLCEYFGVFPPDPIRS